MRYQMFNRKRNYFQMMESKYWFMGLIYLLDPALTPLRAKWSPALFGELCKTSMQALASVMPIVPKRMIKEYCLIRRLVHFEIIWVILQTSTIWIRFQHFSRFLDSANKKSMTMFTFIKLFILNLSNLRSQIIFLVGAPTSKISSFVHNKIIFNTSLISKGVLYLRFQEFYYIFYPQHDIAPLTHFFYTYKRTESRTKEELPLLKWHL